MKRWILMAGAVLLVGGSPRAVSAADVVTPNACGAEATGDGGEWVFISDARRKVRWRPPGSTKALNVTVQYSLDDPPTRLTPTLITVTAIVPSGFTQAVTLSVKASDGREWRFPASWREARAYHLEQSIVFGNGVLFASGRTGPEAAEIIGNGGRLDLTLVGAGGKPLATTTVDFSNAAHRDTLARLAYAQSTTNGFACLDLPPVG